MALTVDPTPNTLRDEGPILGAHVNLTTAYESCPKLGVPVWGSLGVSLAGLRYLGSTLGTLIWGNYLCLRRKPAKSPQRCCAQTAQFGVSGLQSRVRGVIRLGLWV